MGLQNEDRNSFIPAIVIRKISQLQEGKERKERKNQESQTSIEQLIRMASVSFN